MGACSLLLIGGLAYAQSTPANQVTVPFSDPTRPGTVKVSLIRGSITVKAGTARDVTVTTTAEADGRGDLDRGPRDRDRRDDAPSTQGMRRLTKPAGVNVEEENNVITVSSDVMTRAEVIVTVPAATSLVLRAVNGGQVLVDGVNGSIDVTNVNGAIRLTNVGGPVTAHATNGRVTATLKQVAAGKPMAFTSFNGDVDVTLPASTKANLKLRSDRGDVYTDFDVKATQPPPRTAQQDRGRDQRERDRVERDRDPDKDKDKGKYRIEVDRSVYGTINGGGPDFELRTFNGDVFVRAAK